MVRSFAVDKAWHEKRATVFSCTAAALLWWFTGRCIGTFFYWLLAVLVFGVVLSGAIIVMPVMLLRALQSA